MPKNLSSRELAWILSQIGITLKRHSKEDVFAGHYGRKNRVVIVPRNKKSIPQGTLSSIWRQGLQEILLRIFGRKANLSHRNCQTNCLVSRSINGQCFTTSLGRVSRGKNQ